jgi:hypothetical protein
VYSTVSRPMFATQISSAGKKRLAEWRHADARYTHERIASGAINSRDIIVLGAGRLGRTPDQLLFEVGMFRDDLKQQILSVESSEFAIPYFEWSVEINS